MFGVWKIALCLFASLWAGCAAGQASAAQVLTQAEFFSGAEPPPASTRGQPVALPDSWDLMPDREERHGWYRVTVTAESSVNERQALYIPRAGNRLAIWWNGARIADFGVPEAHAAGDYAKQPLWVSMPAALVRSGQNELLVHVYVEPGRHGGLSALRFGPESELQPMFASHHRWLVDGSIAVASITFVLGMLALGLWWRQRDVVYFFFGAASVIWALRVGNVLVIHPPLPRLAWETLIAMLYGWYIAFTARFTLDVLNATRPAIRVALWVYVAVNPFVCALSQGMEIPELWSAWLGVHLTVAIGAALVVYREAFTHPRSESLLLAIAGTAAVGAGARDWTYYWLHPDGYSSYSITRYVQLFFTVAMAWLLVERFTRALRGYATLNRELAGRVAEKERELIRQFERAAEQDRVRLLAEERQRIMRDMHDGMGAQLVSALKIAERGGQDVTVLANPIRECLDAMRLTIDALHPTGGDLGTVFGTLRYRLAPHLAGLGIDLSWEVEELPRLAWLSPGSVQHIQKIVQESFTNAIKHAGATRITVCARHDVARNTIHVEFRDNGVGFDPHAPHAGHGLANLRARAREMGGELEFRSGNPGTIVAFRLPVHPDSGAVPPA